MSTIPLLAFTASDAKKNLDIAAKFYVAGAAATPAVAANPSHSPAIPAIPAAVGVAVALLPHFSYASKAAANGTDWVSTFSLLLDYNEKLEVALGNTLASIIPVAGVANVPNLVTTGTTIVISGVNSLEQLIYSLASSNADVTISKVLIGTTNYLKLVADYTFTPTVVLQS